MTLRISLPRSKSERMVCNPILVATCHVACVAMLQLRAAWPQNKSIGSRARRVFALSWPVSCNQILSFLAYMITTSQIGNYGRNELSAVTLGRSVYHITGLSL